MITVQAFKEALDLLKIVYDSSQEKPVLSNEVLARNWYKYFCEFFHSDERFMKAVTHFTNTSKFFPRVPGEIVQAWQESGLDRSPYLSGIQSRYTELQLPDGHQKDREEIENLTEEQQAENAYRIRLLISFGLQYKGTDKQKHLDYLTHCSIEEAVAVVKGMRKSEETKKRLPQLQSDGTFKPPENAMLEDMNKYLISGVDRFRQMAIDWASDPKNGCKIIYKGKEAVQIEYDF